MKKLFVFIVNLILTTYALSAQITDLVKISGTIRDENSAIGYANIVLVSKLNDNQQYTATTDSKGDYVIKAPQGDYIFSITCFGFEKIVQDISLAEDIIFFDFTLTISSIEIDEVTVIAKSVVRHADRFVMNVSGRPFVIGKDASQLLAFAPGVFINPARGDLSIYGQSGTRVMINERLLPETGQEAIDYLRLINAEYIKTIEVIPYSGSDHSADITGGLVKITLKRNVINGIVGSIDTKYLFSPSEDANDFITTLNLQAKINKFSSYASLSYNDNNYFERVKEFSVFDFKNKTIDNYSDISIKSKKLNTRLGLVYDINSNSNVGLELGYLPNRDKQKSTNEQFYSLLIPNTSYEGFSEYTGTPDISRTYATANYIFKIDTLGSMFKMYLDFNNNDLQDHGLYKSKYPLHPSLDTLYQHNQFTKNYLYNVMADYNKKIKNSSELKAGVKYTRNIMDNKLLYEYSNDNKNAWNSLDEYSGTNSFNETILSAYASYSSSIWKLNYSLGLRSEYTHVIPKSSKTHDTKKQEYFDFFPDVNLMLPITNNQSHILIFNFNRKIQRPTFSNLNPYRMPISDNSFIVGNPDLKPAYINSYNITWMLQQTYNITIGINDNKDKFSRVNYIDSSSPDIVILQERNIARQTDYYVNISISKSITSWWLINCNLYGTHYSVSYLDNQRYFNSFMINLYSQFSLANFLTLDVSGYYMSPSLSGNIRLSEHYQVNASLSANLFKNRFTASIYAHDILNSGTIKMNVQESNFHKHSISNYSFRQFGLSLRYNFKVGANFKSRNVESGAKEERERLK